MTKYSGNFRLFGFAAYLLTATCAQHFLLDTLLRHTPISSVFAKGLSEETKGYILINGSSRAKFHIDPREIREQLGRPAINVGAISSRYGMQRAVWESYLRKNGPPSLLIQTLDQDFHHHADRMSWPNQFASIQDEEPIRSQLRASLPDYVRWRYQPLHRFMIEPEQWFIFLSYLPLVRSYDGFVPVGLNWNNSYAAWKAARTVPWALAFDEGEVQNLDAIVRTARSRGVPVVLVFPPIHYDYIANSSNFAEVMGRCRTIADRHGAILLDYSDSPISKSTDNFWDQWHMNATGASRFSKELAASLNAILSRQVRLAPVR
jgi:hypothetical protein